MTDEEKKNASTTIWSLVIGVIMFHIIVGLLLVDHATIDVHSVNGIDTVDDGDSTYIVKFKVIKSIENEPDEY